MLVFLAASALQTPFQLYNIYQMQKYQKYRQCKKKENTTIAALQHNLFTELQNLQNQAEHQREPDFMFPQFQEENESRQSRSNQFLLHKAKNITYTNKNKIEKMKRELKRIEEGQEGFMTGVGFFEKEQPNTEEPRELNEDMMLRDVTGKRGDDLEELRKMIKVTQKNLRMYSHSVYKTQTKVVGAADKCGWNIDAGLALKINRCNLDQMFNKPKTAAEQIRRRTFSSNNPRRLKP